MKRWRIPFLAAFLLVAGGVLLARRPAWVSDS